MLRHFIWSDLPISGPPSSARLDNLLTLKGVIARDEWNVRLPHFPRIRKLGIFVPKDFDWEAMTNLMSNLEHLRSLSLSAGNMLPMKDPCVTPVFKNFRHMYKLSLSCMWPENTIIDSSIFPSSLVKLSLSWSEIRQVPMPELGKLHCLKILFLEDDSYTGEKMVYSAGGFKCPQQLRIFRLQNLKEIEIENGAMPMLNRLSLQWISEMNVVPDLQYLTNLCEFTYFRMSDKFCTRLKGADQHKVQHIASVEAY